MHSVEKKLIGLLKSGEEVFGFDGGHVHDNPNIYKYTNNALKKIDSDGREFIKESIDFGEKIGLSRCVVTKTGDEIVFAKRKGRNGLTRFVKNKEMEDTSFLSLILIKKLDTYEILTAFIGPSAEKEPWDIGIVDNDERERSEKFWTNHALVYGTEQIEVDIKLVKKQFEEKYKYVYFWTDVSNEVYKKHKHLGKSSIYILNGSVNIFFDNPKIGNKKLVKGDLLEVPQNEYHTANAGEQGCEYLVGQEIDEDEVE